MGDDALTMIYVVARRMDLSLTRAVARVRSQRHRPRSITPDHWIAVGAAEGAAREAAETMLNRRHWLTAVIALWGVTLLVAVVGLVVDAAPLLAVSFLLRRVALLLTLVWLLLTALSAIWDRFRPRRGPR